MRAAFQLGGRTRRAGFWVVTASLILGTAGVAVVSDSGVAAASSGFGSPIEIAGSPGGGPLTGVSCTSATTCTAVGEEGSNEAISAIESGGTWGAATEIASGFLYSVSCTSAGNCTAVGQSQLVADTTEPFYMTESGGTWGSAAVLSAPSGGSGPLYIAGFNSVSCSDATDCTAVGGNKFSSIYATETGGTWGPVAVIPGSPVGIAQVSCTSAGNCTAVGQDTNDGEPLYVTQSGGSWGAFTDISAPAGDGFNSVSCTSAGNCTAVGEDPSGPFYATESGGTWGSATSISDAGGGGYLYGVSCNDSTDCTAVGYDNDGSSYVTETGGSWGSMIDIAGTSQGGLDGVSCTSATVCVAVGFDGNFNPIYTSTVVGGAVKLGISSAPLPTATIKVPYSSTITASGGNPPYKWKVSSGKLPKGLRLKAGTGVISGTPNKHDSGTYTFTVKVVDKKIKIKHHPATQNTATEGLSITIS